MVRCEIFCVSVNMSFYYFQFFPFIINRYTTWNGKKGKCIIKILGVILYMKMHLTLYWCYTVESLVINKDLVQTTCSTSRRSQSFLLSPILLFLSCFSAGFTLRLCVRVCACLCPVTIIKLKQFIVDVSMNVILTDGDPIYVWTVGIRPHVCVSILFLPAL